MRQVGIVGVTLAAILVFGQLLSMSVGNGLATVASARVSERGDYAPDLQTTATATTTTGGTTGGTTATASPGNLPNTGAGTNLGFLMLAGIGLIFVGAVTMLVMASRRQPHA